LADESACCHARATPQHFHQKAHHKGNYVCQWQVESVLSCRSFQQQTDDLRAQLADNSLELQRLQADKAQLSALLHAQKNTDGAEGRHAGTPALSDIQDELSLKHQQGADMREELIRLQSKV